MLNAKKAGEIADKELVKKKKRQLKKVMGDIKSAVKYGSIEVITSNLYVENANVIKMLGYTIETRDYNMCSIKWPMKESV